MPKFEFKAFTQEGQLKEGIITAANREEALKILQEQNLLVTYLSEKKLVFFKAFLKPRPQDIYLFSRQLSYLLQTGTPLDEAIKALSEPEANPYFKGILIEIYNDLVAGIPFSKALEKFPDVFDSYYIGLVKVGESVGTLDKVLNYIAGHIIDNIKFRNNIIRAFIYPAFVVFILIAILIALFYYVIPQIAGLFIENNIPMPIIIKVLQNISLVIKKFGLILLFILIPLIYYLIDYFKTREGKVVLFNLLHGLPFFGSFLKNIYSSRFLESLHYLLEGGVPIIDALTIVQQSIDHPLYEQAIEYAIEEVKKGKPLSEALAEFPELFQSFLVKGLETAEKTGQSPQITLTLYRFYEETIENQLNNLSEALQPIVIIILGAALALLEASLLIPLLNLTKYVQSF